MQNIMFSGDNPQKILDGAKTLTARYWKRKPPKVGELVTASTGYKKETRFAILRITGVHEWDGNMGEGDAEAVDRSIETGDSRAGRFWQYASSQRFNADRLGCVHRSVLRLERAEVSRRRPTSLFHHVQSRNEVES